MSGIFTDPDRSGEAVDVEGGKRMSALLRGELPPAAAAAPEPDTQSLGKAQSLADAESQRTQRSRIDAIQRQLRFETASAGRGYGLRSLVGSLGTGRSSLLGSG